MQWHHYNSIKSAVRYIEGLLREIEAHLVKKDSIYNPVEMDLDEEQVTIIKKQLNKLYADLKEAKRVFSLETEPIKLSRLIDANTGFIWKTIEDSFSSEIEKKSGKITSDDKKKRIDELLNKILKSANRIREAAKYEAIKTK